ncbi:MAG: hypothetical protein A2145_01735 [candidate division Zixibacteria bacterium RBG_16_40_9]|nr:MAG: hypothetical protein A2145_01735 [candidate division Zixibacteria bacterium RBG_16_40_9]
MRWYNASAYYAIALSQALSQRGHKVLVAGDFPSPPLEKAAKLNLPTYPQLHLSRWDHTSILVNLKRLSDLIKEEKIELINAHRGEGHFYASLIKKLFNPNIVVIRTRGDIRPPKRNLFNNFLNHKLTDAIITSCKVLEESYQKDLNFDSFNLRNIPVGIDTKYFTPDYKSNLRQQLGLDEKTPVVGMVGRLSPVKGHIYFIDAAKFVLEKFPQVKFLIAGGEAQISKMFLIEKARSFGMEKNFYFLGRVPDVRDVISALDIGVVASIGSESVCRVALEYMAMGKPVVATRINAIPEAVCDSENGFLVQPQNGKEMGEAILRLLQDAKKRKGMGEKSRQLAVEKFSLEKFGEETEKFYYQVLNEKSS